MGPRENRAAVSVEGVEAITPCGACPVRSLAVCSVLAPDELSALADIVHEVRRAHRQLVIVEGDPADHFFVVTSGVASVEKLLADGRRQIVGFLYPSDFFGLAADGCYAYNVTAVTNLSLCRFERQQYLSLIDRFPQLETRLLGHKFVRAEGEQGDDAPPGWEKVPIFELDRQIAVKRKSHYAG